MGDYPQDIKYTKDHEWARRSGDLLVVGVTAHAQESLGDVVYVELPHVGDSVTAGKPFGVIESTKAVSELFAPVSGKIVKVNEALTDAPETVNQDPYGKGWLVELEPSDPSAYDGLLSASEYQALLENA